jgi:hypothetical protein
MHDWQLRPQLLVSAYIKKHLNISGFEATRKISVKGLSRVTSYEDDKKNGSNSD